MTLDELVIKRMAENKQLKEMLADYAGRPAVFYQSAPDDTQIGWNAKTQYPRIVYNIDMQANRERKSAGELVISVYCNEIGIAPEEVEPFIRESLKDIVMKPDASAPYCFSWARTDSFEISERVTGANTLVCGIEIRFDVLEFPKQETTDPDPIDAINCYIKSILPNAFVLGMDDMSYYLKPGVEEPVFYSRLVSTETIETTNTVAWLECKIAVHILCPQEVRLKYLMDIAVKLSIDGEVTMIDKSPMEIKKISANNEADYLKDGQLFLTARYGILRYKNKPHILIGANFN